MGYVACGYLKVRVQVENLCREVREVEGQEIAVCVDLEGSKGREGEVCGSARKLRGYAAVERTVCSDERRIIVKLKGWDARNGKCQ